MRIFPRVFGRYWAIHVRLDFIRLPIFISEKTQTVLYTSLLKVLLVISEHKGAADKRASSGVSSARRINQRR